MLEEREEWIQILVALLHENLMATEALAREIQGLKFSVNREVSRLEEFGLRAKRIKVPVLKGFRQRKMALG